MLTVLICAMVSTETLVFADEIFESQQLASINNIVAMGPSEPGDMLSSDWWRGDRSDESENSRDGGSTA